ncbi:hypothetical protein P9112_006718 [Eukaryota sp. TZLM1-RC]
MGDWRHTYFKHQAPTKNVGYQKIFKKRNFHLLLLYEYRKNFQCHACVLDGKEGENVKKQRLPNPGPYRRAKTPAVRRHGLLTCKKCGCLWNRNANAVLKKFHVDQYLVVIKITNQYGGKLKLGMFGGIVFNIKIISSLHDAVRDTVFNMAKTARISCIKEPLLKETLSLNNFDSDDRGDVYCDWIDNSEAIVDFVSCNVANDTLVHRRKLNPVAALDFKAKEKHRKYDKEIEDANVDRNTQLVFIAFPFSINGRLSVEAETFLDDFQKMVKEKTMKRFDIFLWRSRIQFAIIKRLPRFFNRIREALARQQANQDFVEEILVL